VHQESDLKRLVRVWSERDRELEQEIIAALLRRDLLVRAMQKIWQWHLDRQ